MYFFKPSWGGPGGSPGGLGGSGNPVGLEKLVDSMTCKLSPTTKIHLAPNFWRVQLRISKNFLKNPRISQKIPRISKEILVLSPKMAEKPKEMLSFSPKCSFFQHKSARQGFYGPVWQRPPSGAPMPCGPKNAIPKPNCVFRAYGSPLMLAMGPIRGPTGLWHKRMS